MGIIENRIKQKLVLLYGEKIVGKAWKKLDKLLKGYRKKLKRREFKLSQKDTVLITYGDAFIKPEENPFKTLEYFLNTYLKDIFTIIHILPFFPFSSDDGFSVINYKEVKQKLGNWEDIERLGKKFHLMFDGVINHISSKSKEFQKFLKGDKKYSDFFIIVDENWDLFRVFRPRAFPLLTEFQTRKGPVKLWTTFSSDQIDLNFKNPDVLLYIIDILLFYVEKGASIIRLDAIAYLWKESGTSCIHLPQTHTIIKLFRDIFELLCPWVKIITETNVPHMENISYFGDGTDEAHMVYNFALPPLTVNAILEKDASVLSKWAKTLHTPSKTTYFYNFTASHDGIGLLPAKHILSDEQIQNLIQTTLNHGGRVSYKRDLDGKESGYELNISLFDLLSDPKSKEPLSLKVKRFIATQAVALSLCGIPAIYYHSVVGSQNYYEGVEKTGSNRAINREKLNLFQVEKEVNDPASQRHMVFHSLSNLISKRQNLDAFNPEGEQKILDIHPSLFSVERSSPDSRQLLLSLINVSPNMVEVMLEHPCKYDVLSGKIFKGRVNIGAYEVLWLIG